MSPRAGGEADKFGGRYEGRWIVRRMLDVLAGLARSILIEERGESGDGIEFTVVMNDGQVESHQVKRQRGNRNGWSIRDLREEGVLAAAAAQVTLGRRFWFVSLVPARPLDELSDQASRSDDLKNFRRSLSKELEAKFTDLSNQWNGPQRAFEILQKIDVEWPSERELRTTNAVLAERLIEGAPGWTIAAALAALAHERLGQALDARSITEGLTEYGLLLRGNVAAGPAAAAQLDETLAAWTRSIERDLLTPEIPRKEADHVVDELVSGPHRVLLVAGAAGHGKSAVLHQAVRALSDQWPVTAMRFDGLGSFASTYDLGVSLGLGSSPVAALAAVADGRECLLVIDQLDAVSLASGRLPERFDQIADLIDETAAFPNMRVLLACRQFDIDNDHRLQRLVSDDGPANQLSIGPLTRQQIETSVAAMGLEPTALSESQHELLKVPLHLVLLSAISDQPGALGFSTAKGLMDGFYERKRDLSQTRRAQPVRFDEAIGAVVEAMDSRQRLYAPRATVELAGFGTDARLLESEHILVGRTEGYSFFHEAFFDYVFARRWLARDETLVDFLLKSEQELFRRAQVRQILVHLRADQPERFADEVRRLLDEPAVRFHIKDVVLALLQAAEDPTRAEWQLVARVLDDAPLYVDRVYSLLRTPAWFDRLLAEGVITDWIRGDQHHVARAADVMISAARDRPVQLAALFRDWESNDTRDAVLRAVALRVDLHSSRDFFELLLDAVRRGAFDQAAHNLFLTAHDLGQEQPGWAVELLKAWLVDRTDALKLDAEDKVAALNGRDHGIVEMIGAAANNAPGPFADFAVSFLLRVMDATDHGEPPSKRDKHFGYRIFNIRHLDIDDALFYGARNALRALVTSGEHQRVAPLLDALATDDHDAAQWLLYEAMAADGKAYVDRTVELLGQGDHRFLCGYLDNPYWGARELIVSIGPHLTGDQFRVLEHAFLAFRPEFESRPFGRGSFTMLSALPSDRLSQEASGRMRELRRVFGETPRPPVGIIVGTISSPIPDPAAEEMNDEQWLRAIDKHDGESRDWGRLTGGAQELAQVLQAKTALAPERFARLAKSLDGESHPAYLNAVLYGLAEAPGIDLESVLEVMRHAAAIGRDDHDRALPYALKQRSGAVLPDDILGLVLDIALNSRNPTEETWQRPAPSGGQFYGGDPFLYGFNSARGFAAFTLGDLLMHDADGSRTRIVARHFDNLAADPSLAVRTCVAHTLVGGLRHAREEVFAAFQTLIEAPDELLGTGRVEELVMYLGATDNAFVAPLVERMIASRIGAAQEAGGRLAAYAGLELGLPDLLDAAAQAVEPQVRKGAATACASRLPITAEAERAEAALALLFDDADDDVRDEAASAAAALRDRPLGPHKDLIQALIASAAFEQGNTQLLITLDHATERVDDLILATARRFLEVYKGQLGDLATHAAADAGNVGSLLLRAYAQAETTTVRGKVLDLVDELLIDAAYGFAQAVGKAER